jgi:CubicO group peptidase (beta-lactamase class C family)
MQKLVLAALLTIFSGLLAADDTDDGNASAAGDPRTWAYVEITEEHIASAVQALPDIIVSAMERSGVPGIAAAVVRSDRVLFTGGFGMREVGGRDPVDENTVFQLASLSKPVGATVVSRAVHNGSVSWNDPVTHYLPWFQIGDSWITENVTIGDLYSHRSGLPDHAGDDLEDLGFNREQILRRLKELPLGPFRAQYAYTNFGLTAAAEAVARANGTTWEQLSETLLYRPAGMLSTSSRYGDYLSASNRAVTHQRQDGRWVPGPPRDPQAQSPAGGVSSTARDMARWMQLQLGNGTLEGEALISPDVLQVMRQPHMVSDAPSDPVARPSFYGFGLVTSVDGVGHVRWSHSGAFLLGAATTVVFLPAGDIGIAVLTNGQPHGIPEAITAEFVDIVETGQPQRDWLPLYESAFSGFYHNPSILAGELPPENPQPALPFANYMGSYDNPYFGPARVSLGAEGLEMALGPVPYRFALTHWDGNLFAYYPRGENAVGIAAVSFDPAAQTMTVENLDTAGVGTFKKERLGWGPL